MENRKLERLKEPDRPSWPGGVARSAGVVVQDRRILHVKVEPPPRLRLRRSHPSWPGGAIPFLHAASRICICLSHTPLPRTSGRCWGRSTHETAAILSLSSPEHPIPRVPSDPAATTRRKLSTARSPS